MVLILVCFAKILGFTAKGKKMSNWFNLHWPRFALVAIMFAAYFGAMNYLFVGEQVNDTKETLNAMRNNVSRTTEFQQESGILFNA